MSVSFGLKKAGSKRKAGAQLAAFGEEDEQPEPELSDSQKQAESERLQVWSHLAVLLPCQWGLASLAFPGNPIVPQLHCIAMLCLTG